MARIGAKSSTKGAQRQVQGNQSWRIEKRSQQPVRKSARLERALQRSSEAKHLPSPPRSNDHSKELCSPKELGADRRPELKRKRKRSHEVDFCEKNSLGKRPRTSSKGLEDIRAQSQVLDKSCRKQLHIGSGINAASKRIHHWVHGSRWPKKDFEPDPNMYRPASKRSRSSLSQGRQSDTSTPVPSDGSDQRSRAQKSSPYAQPSYATLLAYKKGYMYDSEAGILASEKDNCRSLLDTQQVFPSGSLFDDECFPEVCANLQSENEMRVVIDLLRLIAPSAENLAARGIKKLKYLKEHTNAGWNESIPVQGPRPQPDYSVGFRFGVFSDNQFNKLHYHLKIDTKKSFAATLEMFFPFMTAEVKCGKQALEIADRQNAHSMTVAIRGVVDLFRKVGRAKELHRKALGFSISHDDQQVRIHVHYPEIDELSTECYRHTLRNFSISDNGGKERWSAYQFVCNIYDLFVPKHLERIQSAIDQLPNPVPESVKFTQSADDAESLQEIIVASAPSSQEAGFKKPYLPLRGRVADLQAQIDQLTNLLGEAKRREDQFREQSNQLRKESNQRHVEFMELLKEHKEQNKKLVDVLSKS